MGGAGFAAASGAAASSVGAGVVVAVDIPGASILLAPHVAATLTPAHVASATDTRAPNAAA